MDRISNKHRTFCIYLALAAITFGVFCQLLLCDFIYYDDPQYVTENPDVYSGLTGRNIIWAFTTPHGKTSYWHPLTWLSHMVDCQLFGLNAHRHHATSLLFHIANTLLLFWVLRSMTGSLWRSAFVAAAFALHPLHVESVAWIAERKDVLSTFFALLTMAAYLRYVKHKSIGLYLLTLLLFMLGLMSKPTVVTLPLVLLLLDFWPLGRFQDLRTVSEKPRSKWQVLYRLVMEKIPFLVLSAVISIVTIIAQKNIGSLKKFDAFPITARISNAIVSYVKYIEKMIMPTRLAVLYPHPGDSLPLWWVIIAALLLVIISVVVIRLARGRKYLLVGWLWYLGTLVPVIGLVQVGAQAMADRYTYIPLTGLFIIIAWGLPDLLVKWRHRKAVLAAVTLVVLFALSVSSWFQVGRWQNSVTIFEHTLKSTKDNFIIHYNLGIVLDRDDQFARAIEHYNEALRVKPIDTDIRNNLAVSLSKVGRFEEATAHFYKVLRINPDYAEAHYNLANTFREQGKLDKAANHYRRALDIEPDNAEIYNNLGAVLKLQGKLDEAISHYQEALKLKPDYARAYNNLGSVLLAQNKLDEAISHFQKALQIDPGYTLARRNLNVALQLRARPD